MVDDKQRDELSLRNVQLCDRDESVVRLVYNNVYDTLLQSSPDIITQEPTTFLETALQAIIYTDLANLESTTASYFGSTKYTNSLNVFTTKTIQIQSPLKVGSIVRLVPIKVEKPSSNRSDRNEINLYTPLSGKIYQYEVISPTAANGESSPSPGVYATYGVLGSIYNGFTNGYITNIDGNNITVSNKNKVMSVYNKTQLIEVDPATGKSLITITHYMPVTLNENDKLMTTILDTTYTFRDYIFIQLNKTTPNLQLKCNSYNDLDISNTNKIVTYNCIGCILYMNNNYVYVKFNRYDTETPFIVFGSKEIALTTTKGNIFERIRLHGYIFLYIKADIYNIIKTKEQEIKSKYTVEKQKAEASAKQQSDATYTKSSIRNLKEAAAEIERQSRVAEQPLRGGVHKTRRYKRYLHRSRKASPRK
jgi:hypothetical protein